MWDECAYTYLLARFCIFSSRRGGFGPVADDGYGVSYMVSGERVLFFHVSSRTSSKLTNSKRFMEQIFRALADMKEVLTLALASPTHAACAAAAPDAPVAPPAAQLPPNSGGARRRAIEGNAASIAAGKSSAAPRNGATKDGTGGSSDSNAGKLE